MEQQQRTTQKKPSVWSEIEPLCILQAIARNFWMVLMAAGLTLLAAYLFMTLLGKPTYTCTASFAVTSRVGASGSSITKSTSEQFASLLTDSLLIESVRVDRQLDVSGVSVSSSLIENTNLIELRVTADTPQKAYDMAAGIIEHYSDYSSSINSVVLRPVRSPGVPTSSGYLTRRTRTMLIAGAGGAVAMAVLLGVLSVLSGTVQTVTGARRQIDGEYLSAIGHVRKRRSLRMLLSRKKTSLLISNPATGFAYAEAVNRVTTRLEHEKRRRGATVFLVTSVSENEGKSTIAANLALSLAKKHKKVLLADCDLRKPAQHLVFEQAPDRKDTLNALIERKLEPDVIVRALQYRKNDNLFCLFSRPQRHRSGETFGSANMQQLVSILRKNFDFVIIDSPPMGYFSDSEQLADLSDMSLLIVRQDGVTALAINDAIDALSRCRAHFLGYVLNDMRRLFRSRGGYGYGYGYGYGGRGKRYGYGYGYGSKDGETVGFEQPEKTEVRHGE